MKGARPNCNDWNQLFIKMIQARLGINIVFGKIDSSSNWCHCLCIYHRLLYHWHTDCLYLELHRLYSEVQPKDSGTEDLK